MKKSLLLAGMLAVGLANAQTGKVGINTESPNETLEVNGTLRVDNLPTHNEGKIYDGAETTETTFTGTRVVIADEQGNVGKTTGMNFFPQILVGGDGKDAFARKDVDYPATTEYGGRVFDTDMRTETFTLTKRSLVAITITSSFSFTNVDITTNTKRVGLVLELKGKDANGNDLLVSGTNGQNKFQNVINTGINTTFLSGEETKAYQEEHKDEFYPNTTEVFNSYLAGIFGVGGSTYMVLEPGDYTARVYHKISMAEGDFSRVKARLGNSGSDKFDVIAFPLEF